MLPDVEQELTHTLLIELLSYQFTFPVRWIETQDVILGEQKTERLIEVGPGNTLRNMAKATIDQKYSASDPARSLSRQLLSQKSSMREIYYLVDEPTEDVAEAANTAPQNVIKAPRAVAAPLALVQNTVSPAAQSEIPDRELAVSDAFMAVVCHHVKKNPREVPMDATIRSLAAGRSTLQNETIGDLEKEFGALPERPEDLSLEQLVRGLESTFKRELGVFTKQLIERTVSTKMSAGFKTAAAREYLQAQWGLGRGHQDAVLLLATSMQPAKRLSTTSEVEAFFAEVVERYAEDTHITLGSPRAVLECPTLLSGNLQLDPGQLKEMRAADEAVAREKIALDMKALGMDFRAGERELVSLRHNLRRLQSDLDFWSDEHGAEYAAGIVGKFSAKKARVYDSWWNWGLQEFWTLIHDMAEGRVAPGDAGMSARRSAIMNRADARILNSLAFADKRARAEDASSRVAQFTKELLEDIKASVARPSKHRCVPAKLADGASLRWRGPDVLTKVPGQPGWTHHATLSQKYRDVLRDAESDGLSFAGRKVLVTGAGPGSIGARIVEALLRGGAHVLVTSSGDAFSETARTLGGMYASHGGKGSQLILVPFNQASTRDIAALADYIHDDHNSGGLGWDLDHIIPFAALSETDRSIDGIDSRSELAHRVMLTNTIRLLGAVKCKKQQHGHLNHPAQVLLPLSPNHGVFGGDGLYAESKLGLEAMLGKWSSEGWQVWLSICGARIGWTRGTGLMAGNDALADAIERRAGIKTFSADEQADLLAALLDVPMLNSCQDAPLVVDLAGGMSESADGLSELIATVRLEMRAAEELRHALAAEAERERLVVSGTDGDGAGAAAAVKIPAPPLVFEFPLLREYGSMLSSVSSCLRGMVDLSRIPVIVGFSEVGPWGNARTRWDAEVNGGVFSPAGCIELAWMTGLIRHSQTGAFCGWVDARSNAPVLEADVKRKYEAELLSRTGIRLVTDGPLHENQALHEVALDRDLGPFQASRADGTRLKALHGDAVELYPGDADDRCEVVVKKGALLHVPKQASTATRVAGQIPDGWDPRCYGIPPDLIDRLDPVAIYALVGTIEALLSAGITDPYELYNHVHVSEIGNCIGSGIGGMKSLQGIFRDRGMDRPVQSDVLQESFLNTPAAWVNMLLMSSSGPLKTPVGACATALESLDGGCDLITSGKIKLCLVGGVDDLSAEVSAEFANMKATVDVDADLARGRSFAEMSRPATSSRAGFVEAHGCGMQVLASAELAVQMGLPIYGVVAWTGLASDGAGRSIPAPGKGLSTFAREQRGPFACPPPMLDIRYRRSLLESRLSFIQQTTEAELLALHEYVKSRNLATIAEAELAEERLRIRSDAAVQRNAALHAHSTGFWQSDDRISPIRGSLAVWGLGIDDVAVASFHGTSTLKGDENELEVISKQLEHLGRYPGNTLLGVCQKYLTGHPKAAAGAWMLNGCLQMLHSGIVPGNRNADNIDSEFERFTNILIPSRNIDVGEGNVKSFTVSSFGFGQKGAQAICVHTNHVMAVLDEAGYDSYRLKVAARHQKAYRRFHEAIICNNMFVAKGEPPYARENSFAALMDPRPPYPVSS